MAVKDVGTTNTWFMATRWKTLLQGFIELDMPQPAGTRQ
jgi:hypothetical protein